jgi:kynurenine formamidase
MDASLTIEANTWRFDPRDPIDISIPLQFNGPQPNAFGVEPATSIPCAAGDLVGDTRQGGSCNFEQYTFIPHCNGTHTECVGHITHERISIRECLRDVLVPAIVVTVEPESAANTNETYSMAIESGDKLITRRALDLALGPLSPHGPALVIRTAANDESKRSRQYADDIPPYFTSEAVRSVVERGIRHLLVDTPSIDRLYDEGRLSNHRSFWKIEPGSFETNSLTRRNATITELIYVPNEVIDGEYLLNLQIAPFASDASPSRPILFRITKN